MRTLTCLIFFALHLAACGSCDSGANPPFDEDARAENVGTLPDAGGVDADQTTDLGPQPDSATDLGQPDVGFDLGEDAGDTADSGSGAERGGLLEPSWTRTIQGSVSLWGPWVDVASDGRVIGALTYGGALDPAVTFGEGEPNETVFDQRFKTAVAWFDGDDGILIRAVRVGENVSDTERASIPNQAGIDVTPDGELLVGGYWHGSGRFHAGTPLETTWVGQTRLNGDRFDRAENPWVTRYKADGSPDWIIRGRTPGPLTKTWFNNGLGIASLGKDETAFVGKSDGAGFVFGEPSANPVTLGAGSYFARLDSTGNPVAVVQNRSAPLYLGVRGTSDGTAYVLPSIGQNAVIDTGGAALDVVAAENVPDGPQFRTSALVRIEQDDTIGWISRVVMQTYGSVNEFDAADDGSVVVTGSCDGLLELYDADDMIAASEMCDERRAWAARYAPDGTLAWHRVFGEEVAYIGEARFGDDGTLWLSTRVDATADAVELDNGETPLPDVGATDQEYFDVLLAVGDDGARQAAWVIGRNLSARDLSVAGGRLAVVMLRYHHDDPAEAPVQAVVGPNGLETLALAPDIDQQAIFAVFDID